MRFELKAVKNGWRCASIDDDTEEVVMAGDEIENFRDFLHAVLDAFGPTTNRYSDKRISIIFEPGDKNDSADHCEKCDRLVPCKG
jgi:hypothetical protein